MRIFYAGTQVGDLKDPRALIGRDANIMSTYWDYRKSKKKPTLVLQIAKARKQRNKKKLRSKK